MSSIKNVDKLNAKIDNLQNIITDKDFKNSINRANKLYVQAEAKLLCPVNQGELRNSIKSTVEINTDKITAVTYTDKDYASYVEFGTGPVGQANHEGISPNFTPSYSSHGWGIPADKVDPADAIKYKWPKRVYNGKEYYMTNGQPAQPFMYPALKNNESKVCDKVAKDLKNIIRKKASK